VHVYTNLRSTAVVTLPTPLRGWAVFLMGLSMPIIPSIASNAAVRLACTGFQSGLNVNGFLQLYKNNFTPTPDSLLSAFIQTDFPGYFPISLIGAVPPCGKQQTGVYGFSVPVQTFTGGLLANQVVYGAYVVAGANWYAALPLASPVMVNPGTQILIVLQWQDLSLNLISL